MKHQILLVGEYGSRNGGENSLLAVVPDLITRGWSFQAAVPTGSDFSNALNQIGVPTQQFSMIGDQGIRKSQAEIRLEFGNLLKANRPDLVHCNSLSTGRICGPVTHEQQTPALGYLRDILKLSKQAIADLNQLDRTIAVSQATKDWHCEQGLDAHKAFVVHNGVDLDLFSPTVDNDPPSNSLRRELGIPEQAPVLLFVGQIGMRKGLDTLIDAFETIRAKVPQTCLLIAGQRHSRKQEAIEFEQQLRSRTASPTHQPAVHWLGTRTDVSELMRMSTILLHPARQEPLGRVLLEAAASGLPIITTRVGGSSEILSSREFETLLVPPMDPEAIANKAVELIGDRDQRCDLSNRLREMAGQRFSVQRCATHLDGHYRALLGE